MTTNNPQTNADEQRAADSDEKTGAFSNIPKWEPGWSPVPPEPPARVSPRTNLVNALAHRLMNLEGETSRITAHDMNALVEELARHDDQMMNYYLKQSDKAYFRMVTEARRKADNMRPGPTVEPMLRLTPANDALHFETAMPLYHNHYNNHLYTKAYESFEPYCDSHQQTRAGVELQDAAIALCGSPYYPPDKQYQFPITPEAIRFLAEFTKPPKEKQPEPRTTKLI